jgi:hypothetical protein
MGSRHLTALLSVCLVGVAACGGDPEPVSTPIDFTADPDEDQEVATETLQVALGNFGRCMTMESFIGTGIYQLNKSVTKDENGQQGQACQACHELGDGGAYISSDIQFMFDGNTTFPGIMRLVTGTVDDRGNFGTLVPSNRYIEKGSETCPPEVASCHPRFVLSGEMQQSVLTFVEAALERWEKDECGAGDDNAGGT